MHHTFNIASPETEELSPVDWQSCTVVLQPTGELDYTTSQGFKDLLKEALDQALNGVIVDFLWVERVDEVAVQILISAMELAAQLGKTLSFAGMSSSVEMAMEVEWKRQQDIRFGSWQDLFGADLEQFLDDF